VLDPRCLRAKAMYWRVRPGFHTSAQEARPRITRPGASRMAGTAMPRPRVLPLATI
jgi:hypothetical protein